MMIGVGFIGRPGETSVGGLNCEKEEMCGISRGRKAQRGGQLVGLGPLKFLVMHSVSPNCGERTVIPLLGSAVRANSGGPSRSVV